jgi:hypothetical protein
MDQKVIIDKGKIIRENHLDFLYELFCSGVDIGEDNIKLLDSAGYINDETRISGEKVENSKFRDKINYTSLKFDTEKSKKTDPNVDIIEVSGEGFQWESDVIDSLELEERRIKYRHVFEGRKTEITKEEWLPKSTTEHEKDFVEWILSINRDGFGSKKPYRKFSLYVQQAYTWLQDKTNYTDFEDEEIRTDWQVEELRKCAENSLYWLNKYVWYKEGDAEIGKVKYTAAPAHEFLAYMEDCGYSMGIAKGRQIAATTTLMALDVHDVVFKRNHFMKFITEDVDKAQEIIEDKLKFAFSELPDWMRPDVLNERDNMFKMGYKEEKGKREGVGSKIQVTAPKRTAIAGGAPQKVKIDEAGNIKILGLMIGNARPTMMYYDKATGKLVLKRQLVFWGTGGEMDKGGKAFETELMTIMRQFEIGDYSSGIIPIFFNWECRPGATQEDYDREKRVAYAKGQNDQDPDAKRHITEFHQSWPTSLSDVFRTSAKTLVDEEFIEAAIQRIRKVKKDNKYILHESGYFEPVYDVTQVMPEGSDVPYKIIDAVFIPTDDLDPRASVTIFSHPKKTWDDRYFQGTDPIDTNTGLSNMASTVWDKHYKTTSAIINWRVPDYPKVFLQCTLLSLYYDNKQVKTGIKELLESNRGTSYYEYRKFKGLDAELVLNYQLPPTLQNRTTINDGVGIDNKGLRNDMLIHRMFEMFKHYGENMYHEILFEQLKTFTCNVSDKGKAIWGPVNKKHFMDDTLWSTTFSYLCAEVVFADKHPISKEAKAAVKKIEYRLVRGSDNKLTRQPVRVRR